MIIKNFSPPFPITKSNKVILKSSIPFNFISIPSFLFPSLKPNNKHTISSKATKKKSKRLLIIWWGRVICVELRVGVTRDVHRTNGISLMSFVGFFMFYHCHNTIRLHKEKGSTNTAGCLFTFPSHCHNTNLACIVLISR